MSTSYVGTLTPELRRSLSKGTILSREREYELVHAWQQKQDERALRELVAAHTRLVGSLIRRIKSPQLSQQDLFQEGLMGLVEAANRFDPSRGFRFSTYALFWIKAKTREHALRNWSIVRLPLDTSMVGLSASGEARSQQTVPIDPVERLMEWRRNGGLPQRRVRAADLSLDAKVAPDSETEYVDTLVADDDVENEVIERLDGSRFADRVRAVIAELPERERHILTERLLRDPPTRLTEIATQFGVTRERVRQLEVRGMKMLRERLTQTAVTPARVRTPRSASLTNIDDNINL